MEPESIDDVRTFLDENYIPYREAHGRLYLYDGLTFNQRNRLEREGMRSWKNIRCARGEDGIDFFVVGKRADTGSPMSTD